jgi:hypothetical protein
LMHTGELGASAPSPCHLGFAPPGCERSELLLSQVLAIGVESVSRLQQFDDICPRFVPCPHGALPTHVVGPSTVPSRSRNTHVLCPFWVHIVLRYLHHYGKCGVELLVQKQPHAERGGPGRILQQKLVSVVQIMCKKGGLGPVNLFAHHMKMQTILLSQ